MAELLALAFAVLAISTIVRADIGSVLLHEFIPTDSREDIELSATTPDGSMPAAIDTPSGVTRPPTQTEKAYGGSERARGSERVYTPDIDTRRPTVSRYDDPFSPSTTPYKRLRAFDTVLEDYTLGVADSAPRSMPIGGPALGHEDSFFGDLTVDLVPGEGVPIPTVGPGARLIKLVTVPAVGVSITADSADNWYARASVRTRVRLVQWLAVPRESFGGVLRDTPIHLLRGARPVPDHVRRSALEVAKTIGVSQLGTVRETALLVGRSASRGCCRAQDFGFFPINRQPNFYLEPSETPMTPEELVAGVRHGILIEGRGSFGIDQNRVNFQFGGDFFREIRDGKPGRPLKKVLYGSRTTEFWGSCDGIADARFFQPMGLLTCGKGEPMQGARMTHGASPARFRGVTVGGGVR